MNKFKMITNKVNLSSNKIYIILFIPLIFFRIYTYMPINFDGVFFLIYNFIARELANIDNYGRLVGHIFFEIPNILLIISTNPSLKNIVFTYSATVVLVPFFIIALNGLLLKNEDKYLQPIYWVAYCFTCLLSLYFEVNEYNLANSFLFLLTSLLIQNQFTTKTNIVFFILSILLAFTYSYLITIGPIFFIYLYFYHAKNKQTYFAFFSIIISFFTTLILTLHHSRTLPGSFVNFSDSINSIFSNIPAQLSFMLLGLFVICSLFKNYSNVIFCIISFAFCIHFFYFKKFFEFNQLYDGRAFAVLVINGFIVAILFFRNLIRKNIITIHLNSIVLIIFSYFIFYIYFEKWSDLKQEILSKSNQIHYVIPWEEMAEDSVEFKNANTHWNSELLASVIQAIETGEIRFFPERSPKFDPSLYLKENPNSYIEVFENLKVKFHPDFKSNLILRK